MTTRAEEAADQIAHLTQRLPPGTRLGTKDDLRKRCGVSAGTLNEALKLARVRGVITVRPGPGGGLFAAEPSPMVKLGNSVLALDGARTPVAEAVRIRDALDPLIVEDALAHASRADVAMMRERVAAMTVRDPTAFIRANWALHAEIAKVSPNDMLREIYLNLLDIVESHTLTMVSAYDGYLEERYRLHADLVEAIAAHDAATAMRLIREHSLTVDP